MLTIRYNRRCDLEDYTKKDKGVEAQEQARSRNLHRSVLYGRIAIC